MAAGTLSQKMVASVRHPQATEAMTLQWFASRRHDPTPALSPECESPPPGVSQGEGSGIAGPLGDGLTPLPGPTLTDTRGRENEHRATRDCISGFVAEPLRTKIQFR
jgi:hypothetical protein